MYADPDQVASADIAPAPQSNADIYYNELRANNVTDEGARGIIASSLGESGKNGDLNPDARNDKEGSYGFSQWRGDRLDGPNGLRAFAAANDMDPADMGTQAKFAVHEMQTNKAYAPTWAAATDPNSAAIDVLNTHVANYERPKDVPGEIAKRSKNLGVELAGAVPTTGAVKPVATEDDTDDDTNAPTAAPVPTTPGSSYTPLVSRGAPPNGSQTNGNYEPSFTGGPRPNMLAYLLANGGVTSAPSMPPGMLATALKNGAPSSGPTLPPGGAPLPPVRPAGLEIGASSAPPAQSSPPGAATPVKPLAAALGYTPPGMLPAPPGTHYSSGPGDPLLLRDDQDAMTAGGQGGFSDALYRALSGQPPRAPAPMPVASATATGATPATGAPLGTSGSIPIAGKTSDIGGTVPSAPADTPQQAELRRAHDDMRMQEDAAIQRLNSATTPETAKIYAEQLQQVRSAANQLESKYADTLKATAHPTTAAEASAAGISESDRHNYQTGPDGKLDLVPRVPGNKTIMTNDQLTQAERDAGGEWQIDTATGERTQVKGAEGAKTRLATADDVPPGVDYHGMQVTDGKLELIPTADENEVKIWRAVNADKATRGEPPIPLNDFIMEKSNLAHPGNVPVNGVDGKPLDSNLTGLDVIKAVPPEVGRMAQAMIDGRQPVPNLTVRTDPVTRQAVLAAQQADPSLEIGNATARVKVRNEFTSGGPTSPATRIEAGNKAINHMDEAKYYAQSLRDLGFDSLNAAANAATGGNTEVARALAGYNTAVNNYAGEIVKFNTGAEGSLEDRKQKAALFSPNLTQGERQAAFESQLGILTSNMDALKTRWRTGMGPLVPDVETIHPDSAAAVERIKGNLPYPAPGGLPPSLRTPSASQGSQQPGVATSAARQPAYSLPQAAPSAAPPPGAPSGTRQAPDGNFYAPDPSRPGKYLQVRP